MIELRELTAGYGKLEILQAISLRFADQKFSALLGPNGSGKSTMLKAIMGVNRVFDGAISLDGRDITGMPTEAIARLGIAYVPQTRNIFDELSVDDNLQLGARRLRRDERPAALDEIRAAFPILARRQGQAAGSLSGGERQMLAIAIAWLARPQVMLLDEPSAGLAPAVAGEVFQALDKLREAGMTLVVVEQNARRALRHCDYAFVLREGRLAFSGTADECLRDEETVRSYLGVG